MGYELKLYIVEPSTVKGSDGVYCSVIAMVDVCKPGYDTELFKLNQNSNRVSGLYFYMDDGNTKCERDSYGEKIRFAPLEEVLRAVEKDNRFEKYRRFDILIACLKAVKKGKFRDPMVAFYGY